MGLMEVLIVEGDGGTGGVADGADVGSDAAAIVAVKGVDAPVGDVGCAVDAAGGVGGGDVLLAMAKLIH